MTRTSFRSFVIALALGAGPLGLAAPGFAAEPEIDLQEFENFMDVYARIKADHVKSASDHDLLKGAIDGILDSLDPHSSYAEGSDFDDLSLITTGEYGGLGILSTIENGLVRVIAPTEDTPAWRAGIKPGDYLIRIGGELMYGQNLDQAVDRMRGAPGTQVELTLLRRGRPKPFKLTLTREAIAVRPVKWQVKDGIGIVNLNRFTGNSGAEVRDALDAIAKATGGKATGYILDVRSNGGGVLQEAVAIADLFLDEGEIVSQRGRAKGAIERYYAHDGDMIGGKPLIVLIDAGSASASEIVAGALQEHGRGLIVGERSFGKGSVQTMFPLGQRRALRLTTDLYYLPSGRSVQAGGIVPDIVVPQLSDEDYSTRVDVREADLRQHLIAEGAEDVALLEEDAATEPRFSITAAELKKQGVDDFQLEHSLKTLKRIDVAAAPAGQDSPAKG